MTSGVAAATAAMRPAGEAVLRQAGVTLSSVKTVNAASKVVAPGSAAAARLSGASAASAVSNNTAMAPERVVRQRAIPGWSPGEKPKAMSSLEQQRAMVAALRAQAKEEASRGKKAQAAAGAAAAGAAPPVAGRGAGAAPGGGGNKAGTGQAVRRLRLLEDDSENEVESEDSDSNPFSRYLREDASSGSLDEPAAAPPPRDFKLEQEDFPAFLGSSASATTGVGSASASATPTPTKRAAAPVTPQAAAEPPVSAVGSVGPPASAEPSPDAAAVIGDGEDDPDPVVCTDPVYAAEDGTLIVMDAHYNYHRMEDVYGPAPEMIGFQDEAGDVTYHVVIRKSAWEAHLAAAEQEEQQQVTPALTPTHSLAAPALETAYSDVAAAAQQQLSEPQAAAYNAGLPAAPAAAAPGGYGFAATAVPDYQYAAGQGPTLASVPSQPAPLAPVAAAAAEEDEGGLDDLLALCMGGSGGGAAAPGSVAAVFDPVGATAPPAAVTYAAPTPLFPVAPQPQQPHQDYYTQQQAYVGGGRGGYGAVDGSAGFPQYQAVPAAPAAAPERAELDDLMQLLCV